MVIKTILKTLSKLVMTVIKMEMISTEAKEAKRNNNKLNPNCVNPQRQKRKEENK